VELDRKTLDCGHDMNGRWVLRVYTNLELGRYWISGSGLFGQISGFSYYPVPVLAISLPV